MFTPLPFQRQSTRLHPRWYSIRPVARSSWLLEALLFARVAQMIDPQPMDGCVSVDEAAPRCASTWINQRSNCEVQRVLSKAIGIVHEAWCAAIDGGSLSKGNGVLQVEAAVSHQLVEKRLERCSTDA
uniref:Uncharacterized protein n=1 Tax=Haptolina ericina TaxID=156174 RepID=A0A7S3F1V4_9EUKA